VADHRRHVGTGECGGQIASYQARFRTMSSVVFLRGVNVGGANLCRPTQLTKQLSRFGVVNIGAVGTFVVRKNVSTSVLRSAFAKKLPFKCEIMIIPARDIIELVSTDPFAGKPFGPEITRFVNVLAKPLPRVHSGSHQTSNFKLQTSGLPALPLNLPSENNWLLKIVAIQNRFVLGLYRRQMKAIGYLGKIERLLGVPATTRNWNTIQKVATILKT
jgi:uncharacterized protein (DUF1697 family)